MSADDDLSLFSRLFYDPPPPGLGSPPGGESRRSVRSLRHPRDPLPLLLKHPLPSLLLFCLLSGSLRPLPLSCSFLGPFRSPYPPSPRRPISYHVLEPFSPQARGRGVWGKGPRSRGRVRREPASSGLGVGGGGDLDRQT